MILKYLYNRNKQYFWDLIVADFFGDIPSKIKEPSVEFLSNARGVLEPFWSIQAYNIQRRAISDPKNAQIYQGVLLSIRTLLAIVSKGKVGVTEAEVKAPVEKEQDPMERIQAFIKAGKTKKS